MCRYKCLSYTGHYLVRPINYRLLVISSDSGYIPRFLRCDDLYISDHSCVVFDLPQTTNTSDKKTITYRNTLDISIESLKQDISDQTLKLQDTEDIIKDYEQTVSGLLEKTCSRCDQIYCS